MIADVSCCRGVVAAVGLSLAAQAAYGLDDRSLPLAEYVRAGVPAVDRRWSAGDMTAAARALAALAGKDARSLPVRGSGRSGALFARITAIDNLAPFRDPSTPLAGRMEPVLDFQAAAGNVQKLYLAAAVRHGGYAGEIIEFTGLMLHLAVVQQGLLRELVPTLKKDDPTYLTRMNGLQQAREGTAQVVAGALGMLTDRSSGLVEARLRLVAHMEETLPSILTELSPPRRVELLALLERLAGDPSLRALQPALSRVQEKVRSAVRHAPADLPGIDGDDLRRLGLTMHRIQAGEPDASGWCRARSTGGGFSVSLPARFNDFSQAPPGPGGPAPVLHVLGTQTLAGAKFSVVRFPRAKAVDAGDPLAGLARQWEAAGRQVSRRAVQVAGRAGHEVAVRGDGTAAVTRSLVTEEALYQMTVEYPVLLEAALRRDVERFFESFTPD